MLLFPLLLLASWTAAQSLVESNTCLKRSVHVYTAGSSTYVVTNLGSTSLAAAPTYCANASTLTVDAPAATVTVYSESTSALTNNGFEEGTDTPFNSSSSGPQVSAQVAQGGAIQPYSGNSYL